MKPLRGKLLPLARLLGHQDWLRAGLKNRIITHLFNPESLPPYPFAVNFFGLQYSGRLNCYIDWFVYFYGAYEKQVLFLLRDLVATRQGRPIYIDVGANVGQHALFMSQYCKQVHAFEPFEPVTRSLKENIRRNSITNITIHNVGLGEREEELDFFAPTGANTGTGSFVSTVATDRNRFAGKLQVVSGDECVAKLGLTEVDLIKIDVEGFEKHVLNGLSNTLRSCRPVVLMEFSAETQRSFDREEELRATLPQGYTIKKVITDRSCCVFFSKGGYGLTDFDFTAPGGNILLTP